MHCRRIEQILLCLKVETREYLRQVVSIHHCIQIIFRMNVIYCKFKTFNWLMLLHILKDVCYMLHGIVFGNLFIF